MTEVSAGSTINPSWMLGFLACLCTALPVALAAGTIYHYQDEAGVHHFTDLPTSDKFRPFSMLVPDLKGCAKLDKSIELYSRKYGIDPVLIRAMIQVESGFEPRAVSHAGAQGLMQIMPGTQSYLGLEDPFDPDANVEAGIRYLSSLLERFHSLELALAAYNAGPSRVERAGGIPHFKETREYVQRVLNIYLGAQ